MSVCPKVTWLVKGQGQTTSLLQGTRKPPHWPPVRATGPPGSGFQVQPAPEASSQLPTSTLAPGCACGQGLCQLAPQTVHPTSGCRVHTHKPKSTLWNQVSYVLTTTRGRCVPHTWVTRGGQQGSDGSSAHSGTPTGKHGLGLHPCPAPIQCLAHGPGPLFQMDAGRRSGSAGQVWALSPSRPGPSR